MKKDVNKTKRFLGNKKTAVVFCMLMASIRFLYRVEERKRKILSVQRSENLTFPSCYTV